MDKFLWCLKKKDGIQLVEPNANLADAYIKKAEDALASMRINTIQEWKITTGYYAMYFSLYALLMKIGIKCEIHSCTIEFARQLLKVYISKEDIDFLEESMKARVDTQYYVNKDVPDQYLRNMVKKTPLFVVKCKSLLAQLTEETINKIREKISLKSLD